jgi:hypothetical protein
MPSVEVLGYVALVVWIVLAVAFVLMLTEPEPADDPFDLMTASVERLDAEAWRAVGELRALDRDERNQ